MKTQIIISLKLLLVFSMLTGIMYPLIITGIAQLAFPSKANGSMIIKDKQVIGSSLIGQNFSNNKYFWPRPSAINYNPIPSAGSNYGMTSQVLKNQSFEKEQLFIQKNQIPVGTNIPNEMIFASASGLDPDISVEAARLQAKRISVERKISENQVLSLIDSMKIGRQFFILGEQRINVLQLNIQLDKLIKK
jgi:potassium-transporting ATPase KdpC subunit